MRDIILQQGEQITRSLAVNQDIKIKGKFDSIILAGLGGSGHPGDLLNALGVTKKPLYVHRNYDLPLDYLHHIGLRKPLVIASSYSGNTEETLSAYRLAQDNKLPLMVSAAGGSLQEWATRDSVPFVKIDFPDMQPRHTLLAAFSGITAALINSNLATNITPDLQKAAVFIKQVAPTLEKVGQSIAERIKGKIPVYYSSDRLGFAAKNLKIQTNENAKYPAFWNTFPELNHNELLGFSQLNEMNNPNKFLALLLHHPDDHPRNKARFNVTADLYAQWGVTVDHFHVEGSNELEKILYTIIFGLWTTYYLALEYNIDPVPVAGVESFKDKLKEQAGKTV